MEKTNKYFKGRGAQSNTKNPYLKNEYVAEHIEGIDEVKLENSATKYFYETPKKLINKVDSPDIGPAYSMNPYQGCEHGCIYCYARNTYQYWGFSAGLDFERNIIIKKNAVEVLEQQLSKSTWKPMPIMLSGNTDCYQPAERKMKITRGILETLLKFKHPVGIITKNALILRDLDLLIELNKLNLVSVNISITSLNEELRRMLEPRTVSSMRRLQVVEKLSEAGIPVNVMVAPLIPGLNSHEAPKIIEESAKRGALSAAYTIVRLNGSIAAIFEDWIRQAFPDRADKVLHQIADCHGGQLNDSRYRTRTSGEGNIAEMIANMVKIAKGTYMKGRRMPPLDCSKFDHQYGNDQLSLF